MKFVTNSPQRDGIYFTMFVENINNLSDQQKLTPIGNNWSGSATSKF